MIKYYLSSNNKIYYSIKTKFFHQLNTPGFDLLFSGSDEIQHTIHSLAGFLRASQAEWQEDSIAAPPASSLTGNVVCKHALVFCPFLFTHVMLDS